MTWSAIYQVEDGRLVSGTSDPAKIASAEILAARGYAVKAFADGAQNGPWDPATLTFGTPPANPQVIPLSDFFRRFTPAELAGIQASPDTTVQQNLLVLKSAMFLQIDLLDARTVAMLTYLATHPGGSPLLTPARATTIGTP